MTAPVLARQSAGRASASLAGGGHARSEASAALAAADGLVRQRPLDTVLLRHGVVINAALTRDGSRGDGGA